MKLKVTLKKKKRNLNIRMPRATISYNNNTQIQKLIKKKKKKKIKNQIIEKHLFISSYQQPLKIPVNHQAQNYLLSTWY